ncbi:MAG TPA: hypothetical protein VHL32_01300 [Gemmatimonadaceae bacterium]|jgi:hypothetical protein|nr:hypothetical protein [Gemmatimonadaceae bacterium]
MLRVPGVLFITGFVLMTQATAVSAQDSSYETRALRIEGHHGDTRIVRGADGNVVGTIGIFRGINVEELVSESDKATLEAKQFAHDYGPGTIFLSLGIATLGASIGVSQINDVNRSITTGLTLAGTGLIVYGAGRLQNAYNALARSIWWYNRDLKR